MKKIVAFIGSARKNSQSTKLLNKVLDGAREAGSEIKIYNLNDPGVRGCQGCFYCRSHEGCSQKDDTLAPMYQDIKEADGIVVSMPIYFGGISGQAKTWIDRMYPMLDGNFSPRYPGRKAVTIYAQANADPEFCRGTIDQTNRFFKMFGWDVTSFLIYNTGDPDAGVEESLEKDAFEAGKQMVR